MAELQAILDSGDIQNINLTSANGVPINEFSKTSKGKTQVKDYKYIGYNINFGDGTHQPQGWGNAGQANVVTDPVINTRCLEVKDINATLNTSVFATISAADWLNIHDHGASMSMAFRVPSDAPDLKVIRFVFGFSAATNPYGDYGWSGRGAWQIEVRRNGANCEFSCPSASDPSWQDLGSIDNLQQLRCQAYDSVSTLNVWSDNWADGHIAVKPELQDLGTVYADDLIVMGTSGAVTETGQIVYVYAFVLIIAEVSRTTQLTQADMDNEINFALPPGAANYIFVLPPGAIPNNGKISIQSQAIGTIKIQQPSGDANVLIDARISTIYEQKKQESVIIQVEQYSTKFTEGGNYFTTSQKSNTSDTGGLFVSAKDDKIADTYHTASDLGPNISRAEIISVLNENQITIPFIDTAFYITDSQNRMWSIRYSADFDKWYNTRMTESE